MFSIRSITVRFTPENITRSNDFTPIVYNVYILHAHKTTGFGRETWSSYGKRVNNNIRRPLVIVHCMQNSDCKCYVTTVSICVFMYVSMSVWYLIWLSFCFMHSRNNIFVGKRNDGRSTQFRPTSVPNVVLDDKNGFYKHIRPTKIYFHHLVFEW